MKRSDSRILTTHVGSLPRPASLLELANHRDGPPADLGRYRQALAEAIAGIVQKQAAVGLDIVNDGEFGKNSWANYILDRLSGFEIRPDQLREVEWLGRERVRFGE